jgi:hypothetical protein
MTVNLYVGPPMDEPPTVGDLRNMTLVKVDNLQGYIDQHRAQQRRFLAHFQASTHGSHGQRPTQG